MGQVQIHKVGEVIVHLDMNDIIIAIEIPPVTLKGTGIEEKVITKANNPLCTKGLQECTDEITLEDVGFILVCNYVSIHNTLLEKVVINNKSLEEAYLKAIQERDNIDQLVHDHGYCPSFDPIHKKHGGTYQCNLCSLYGTCMGGTKYGY